MLIRHTACFPLLAELRHSIPMVLAPLVAPLVPIIGLAPGAAPARFVPAVRTAVVARAADDELVAAPPTHYPPRLGSHALLAANAETLSYQRLVRSPPAPLA